MLIREDIERQAKRSFIRFFASWIFGGVAVFKGFHFIETDSLFLGIALFILGFAILFEAVWRHTTKGAICSACKANIMGLFWIMRNRPGFKLPSRVKYCPCCGVSLESSCI